MKTRHLYIQLAVQDGSREHTHHCVTSTLCKDIRFAVAWYASHFWGEGELERHDNNFFWWFDGEITVKIEDYKELTSHEANLLNELFYYPHNTTQI